MTIVPGKGFVPGEGFLGRTEVIIRSSAGGEETGVAGR